MYMAAKSGSCHPCVIISEIFTVKYQTSTLLYSPTDSEFNTACPRFHVLPRKDQMGEVNK